MSDNYLMQEKWQAAIIQWLSEKYKGESLLQF
jgi:hypothetical protein